MKLTPLNITFAVILVWVISEWRENQVASSSWIWIVVLLLVTLLLDVVFRLLFKNLKRIWFLQIGFILVVGILMVILKIR